MSILETHNLSINIGGKSVCQDLELMINNGQCWAILGKNGIGKTTLLHTLAGLRIPASGDVLLNGVKLQEITRKKIAQTIGVLFQDTNDLFPSTVLETTLSGRHPYLGNWQWETKDDFNRATTALDTVDLVGFETRNVTTLSGGERQRVEIATLLTQDPSLLLLDEPSNHLDLKHQINILKILTTGVTKNNYALLMIVHDINLAARFCDHALLLYGEGVTEHGKIADVLNEQNLERLYGHPIMHLQTDNGSAFLPA